MRKRWLCIIAVFFISFFMLQIQPVYAGGVGPIEANSNMEEDKEDDDEDDARWYEIGEHFKKIGEYFTEIQNNLNTIVDNIKMFFEGGLTGILERTIGTVMEAFFNSVSGLINKWVFLTPKLISYDWVQKLWWINYTIALVIFGIGLGLTFINYLRGNKRLSSLLFKALLVGFIGTSLSLYLSDFIIHFKNMIIDELVQDTLYKAYQEGLKNSWSLSSGLTKEDMSFEAFTGLQLCKMIFGGNIGDGEALYKLFLSSGGVAQTGGGILIMLWAMLMLSIIGLFGIVRYGVLGLLGAGAPLWFSWCAFSGDAKPAAGWINIYARSVFLTIIFDIAWIFSVYINKAGGNDFAGMGQQVISCILFTVALIVAIKMWVKWLIKAVANPLTLAGGKVMDSWHETNKKWGKTVENVGYRFGNQKIAASGSSMKSTAEEKQKIQKDKRQGSYQRGSGTSRIRAARNQGVKQVVGEYQKSKVPYKVKQVKDAEQNHIAFDFPHIKQAEDVAQLLKGKLKEDSILEVKSQNGRGIIKVKHTDEVAIDEALRAYEKKQVYWTTSQGHYYYMDQNLGQMVKHTTPPKDGGRYMGLWV